MRDRLSRVLPPRGPVRTLALATLVNTAGVFGLVAGVPMGHLADRRGAPG